MNVLRKDGGVAIYNLTKGKSLPEWLPERKRRKLQQQDQEIARRIELIQEFNMPVATTCMVMSPDSKFVYTAGVYKPRIRCYELAQLSMKFERHLDAEVVAMQCLSQDYSKVAMLLADRSLEIHARYGFHHKIRIPKMGRDMVYHYPSCDMYMCGSTPEIYRFNLDQGQFKSPFVATTASAINVVRLNPMHGLLCAGTDSGIVECFDPRSRDQVGVLDVAKSIPAELIEGGGLPEITAIECFENGLTMCVGTSSGHVMMYDIRSSRPLRMKDHNNGAPIKGIRHHKIAEKVISADTKGIKIWDQDTGENHTSLETPGDINTFCLVEDSGLILTAGEAVDNGVYFIPSLAPAPKWAAYLDSITEELEEDTAPTVYDDFKFITRKELQELGLEHLIGSNILRAYMHGFFMDAKLYREAKTIAKPFEYEEYRKQKLEQMLNDGTAKRIELKKAARALPRVNKFLAQRLMDGEGDDSAGKKRKKKKGERDLDMGDANPMTDDRFSTMFKDQDFELDMQSEQYKLLHPSEAYRTGSDLIVNDDTFERVLDAEESEQEGRGSDDESSDDDEQRPSRAGAPERTRKKKNPKKSKTPADAKSGPGFFELGGEQTFAPGASAKDLKGSSSARKAKKKSFSSLLRAKEAEPRETTKITTSVGGGKTITVTRRRKEKAPESDEPKGERRVRRGVGALGLKKDTSKKYWRGKPV